jgi:Trp operon repressor
MPMSRLVRRIMAEISPATLSELLKQSQRNIDKQLSVLVAQISRQSHAQWSEFPARLIAHSDALKKQADRLMEGVCYE